MKTNQSTAPKFRTDELSMKEYRKLTSTEREEYLTLLQGLEPEELSTNDEYILNQYSIVKKINKKFLEL
jgi:hypothetical protein